jgi:glycosyltransferase involved in cell wall biosynthesis
MRKKTVLIHSNHSKLFTGFGKHKKNLLKYLYRTGKYEIVELSNGHKSDNDELKLLPWKVYGSYPSDPQRIAEIQKDPKLSHAANYGSEMIDEVIKEVKPDIYLGIEDIWAFGSFYSKPWWNKVNCIIHTTLDSLPILSEAVSAASSIKNYFVWASFAEKALKELGHQHVETVRGSLEVENFYRLSNKEKRELRQKFNLANNFIIGFVFRNQLRKSIPNLLDGFKLFQSEHANARLLIHTNWTEGWDIASLLKEKKIDFNLVYTTYVCAHCREYSIRPFCGYQINCESCGKQGGCETANIKTGVDEKQLNEIYNLMHVYCHPFTSGGQEIPVQEAKLTELITLVTNYSCGEDSCTEESGGLPLEWAEYREAGTQFIKASTSPKSIQEQLEKVYNMPHDEKEKMQKRSRQFVIDNFSIDVVGKRFEELFDSLPEVDWDFSFEEKMQNPRYEPDDSLPDLEWVKSLYLNVLNQQTSDDDEGVIHWLHRLKTDLQRDAVLDFFCKVARQHNGKINKSALLKEVDADPSPKIAYVMPESDEDVLISSSIISSLAKLHPNHHIYFFTNPQYFDLIDCHPDVFKVLPFFAELEDTLTLEGKADKKGVFDMVYTPYFETKRALTYTKNNKDIIEYNTYESS